MGPETLANDLTEMLAPFLPLLLKGGDRDNPDTERPRNGYEALVDSGFPGAKGQNGPGTRQWIAPPCPTNGMHVPPFR